MPFQEVLAILDEQVTRVLPLRFTPRKLQDFWTPVRIVRPSGGEYRRCGGEAVSLVECSSNVLRQPLAVKIGQDGQAFRH
jgi:hypothetical protein